LQSQAIGGVHSEFIAGARLDNLVGTYTAITGLIQAAQDGSVSDETMIRVAACYDNEECGSESAQGACSALTEWVLRRVCTSLSAPFEQTMARSFLISADQAHAVHPNYESRHEVRARQSHDFYLRMCVQRNHRPLLHGGVVMKINDNQRYATTSVTQAVLREVAAAAGVPVQRVCVRNDSACGSTIGPLLSTRLAMRTVDVGMPQWAMHSIREVCCTSSIAQATALYAVCSGCTWVHAHGAHEHFRPSTSTVRACLHRSTSSDKSVVCVCVVSTIC
jgi:aspartyl aminopeptidase